MSKTKTSKTTQQQGQSEQQGQQGQYEQTRQSGCSEQRPEQEPELQLRMDRILEILQQLYPHPKCALDFTCPLELLVATILSAQCTDKRVNLVTAQLFKKYRSAEDYANSDLETFEQDIQSTGFYHNKAKNIRACCARLVELHSGQVPADMTALADLPGVGRKTANVVLNNAFGIASGIPVDTHVIRLANRWGLVTTENPVKIETVLLKLIPQIDWIDSGHRIIMYGRNVCAARKPHCNDCPMESFCPKTGLINID